MAEKKYNLMLATEVSEMTAGAAYSFLGLAEWIECNSEYHVVALLKKKGTLYEQLRNRAIETVVVPQRRLWVRRINERVSKMTYLIKMAIRAVLIPIDLLLLRRVLKNKKIDIVHINGLTSGMCAEVANDLGIPVVWHIREFLDGCLSLEFADSKHAIDVINKSCKIIAVSSAVKRYYEKIFTPHIEVVYNAFNVDIVRDEGNKPKDKFKICLLGRFLRVKGQLELVQALALLPEEDRNICEVHFIGAEKDSEYLNEIKAEISKNGIEIGKSVFFDGFVPDAYKNLGDYNCLCTCASMEAFGRTTIEGMLNKCIVIGVDTSGTSELIKDNETGLLYHSGNPRELADKISFCIHNPEAVEVIAENGYKYAVDNLQMDSVYPIIIDIYNSNVQCTTK